MKHLAALQIFLLNISYNIMFVCCVLYIRGCIHLPSTYIYSSRTPKSVYVKTVGEKMIILKFAIKYTDKDTDMYTFNMVCIYIYMSEQLIFFIFARFVFFPFAVWLKLFLFCSVRIYI